MSVSSFASAAGSLASKERAAKKACLNGDPTKGVQLLTDLYVDTNDPTYIFNQGRCFEQNNQYESAINRFREFLRKSPDSDVDDKARAEKHIRDCQAILGSKDPPPPPPLPEKSDPSKMGASSEPPPSFREPEPKVTTAELVTHESPAAPPANPVFSAGSGLRTAGVVVASLGGAALAAGIVLNLKYNSTVDDMMTDYVEGTATDNNNYKTLSQVGYAIGGACVVGGALMYLLGWKADRAVVAPSSVAGNAGVVLMGAF
jgi:hypothetical protein